MATKDNINDQALAYAAEQGCVTLKEAKEYEASMKRFLKKIIMVDVPGPGVRIFKFGTFLPKIDSLRYQTMKKNLPEEMRDTINYLRLAQNRLIKQGKSVIRGK